MRRPSAAGRRLLHARGVARLACWASCFCVLWGLVGCATVQGDSRSESQPLPDLKTASDQTDADRRARVRLELAAAYFAEGKTAIALDEVKQALVARPDSSEAFNLRGLIYGALNEPRLAEDSFQRALRLGPRDGAVMHNYAWFLCQVQRPDDAEAMFLRALQQPQYREALRTQLARGVCLVRARRLTEAEEVLTRAYELDPVNPFTGYHLSEVLFLRGNVDRADFYLRRVHSQPQAASPRSLWLAVRIAHRRGDDAEMRLWGDRLRERFPQSPEALRFEQGKLDDD